MIQTTTKRMKRTTKRTNSRNARMGVTGKRPTRSDDGRSKEVKALEIRFTKAAPWCCPSCGDYYIQDRPAGKDIHGHDTYEYALYHKLRFQVIRRFRTRRQAYEYVSRITGFSRWDIRMGSYGILVNDREYLGVLYNGTMYRITKRTREVATRPAEDERLTGWHMKYVDCLSEAKEIIQREDLP